MYGTIARIHPKPSRLDDLKAYGATMTGEAMPAGFRATYLFEPDRSPYERPTLFLIALFDDEATYRANASSPEQDVRYHVLRDMLDDDPEWMDGTFSGM